MAKKGKFKIMPILLGIGGGIAANQLSNLAQSQLMSSGNIEAARYAPAVAGVAGVAVKMFGGEKLKEVGQGMIVVAGTELAEGLLVKATAGAGSKPPVIPAPPVGAASPRVQAANPRVQGQQMVYGDF